MREKEAAEQLRLARKLVESVVRGAENPAAREFAWVLAGEAMVVEITPATRDDDALVVTISATRAGKGN